MSKKCEDLIEQELKGRIELLTEILQSDDSFQRLSELVLGLSKTELYQMDLSYGGPQDYLIFEYNPETEELIKITYHYLDWFDGAVRVIPTDSDEFKMLEQIFNLFVKIE